MSLIAVRAPSAAAATCVPWFGTQPAAVGGTNNSLTAVASVSPCDAWAVGNYFAGGQQSFIHHWDGTAWEQTPNPNPGNQPDRPQRRRRRVRLRCLGGGGLRRTRSQSHLDRALGRQSVDEADEPDPGRGVRRRSVRGGRNLDLERLGRGRCRRGNIDPSLERHRMEACAEPEPGGLHRALFRRRYLFYERMGGRRLQHQHRHRHPHRALERNGLEAHSNRAPGTTPTSEECRSPPPPMPGRSAGTTPGASESRTLVEQWNGSSWKVVPSPNVGGGSSSPNDLRGVVATSSSNALAVGTSSSSPAARSS